MAVKLFLDDEGTLGCLNLYSTNSRDIDPEDEHVAEVFAAHAAVALGHAREVDQLHQALQSSRTIGTAIGIVMERYHLDRDRAFGFLTTRVLALEPEGPRRRRPHRRVHRARRRRPLVRLSRRPPGMPSR